MKKKQKKSTIWLILGLILVVGGGILFVGAISGWFDNPKVKLDAEYYTDDASFKDLTAEEYEKLVEDKKSFVVMVDQSGCTTADRLREYMMDYMKETGIMVYKMMFEDVKESSLHNQVKYYPSVAIVGGGVVKVYLKADSDEDADKYNNYEIFKVWMNDQLVSK